MNAALPPENERWTLAYRRKKANRFHRVQNWSGTWHEASEMAGRFGEIEPELDIWYVPTRAAEVAGYSHPEDVGNILTYSGKRVLIADTGNLPAELLEA